MIWDYEVTYYGPEYLCVGIDFGIKHYLTLSTGKMYGRPHFFSGCKREMTEERKARLLKQQRGWQRGLCWRLCKRFSHIFIEDLDLDEIEAMFPIQMKDCSHAKFLENLYDIAKKTKTQIYKIDKYYPSSQLCTCGYRNTSLKLSDRWWTCPACGESHNRDVLAAKNILKRGMELQGMDTSMLHKQPEIMELKDEIV